MTKQELINAFLEGKEAKNHNAQTYTRDGARILKLHQTEIASLKDGVIKINTGGWNTQTTRSYINMVLDACNSNWYVIQRKFNLILQEYKDGMVKCEVLWNGSDAYLND